MARIASSEIKEMPDLDKTELYIFASLVFLTLFFGFYPEPLLNTIDISINNLIENYQNRFKFSFSANKQLNANNYLYITGIIFVIFNNVSFNDRSFC